MRIKPILITALILFIPFPAWSDIITGGDITYAVAKGDSIELISARLGVTEKALIRENSINTRKPIPHGFEIRANTRKIVPRIVENGIIVNIPDRMLYYFRDGALRRAFPVGLGMASKKGSKIWRTPVRKFFITKARKNPVWHVPKSIQQEMVAEGKPLKTIVPPGPDNPLGRFSLDTSITGIMIHETIWPATVYAYRSHGCIRVAPENMETFFPDVPPQTTGEIIYVPVKVAATPENRVYLEVDRDVYEQVKDMKAEVKRILGERGLSDRVDWQKIDRVVKERSGNAEDVTK
ncbi:MAG: L,D-transpeptidase family protein [Nitrospirales bacterium]|nr:L,D-transpeptidase family protein [Nitrospirales bacterium]